MTIAEDPRPSRTSRWTALATVLLVLAAITPAFQAGPSAGPSEPADEDDVHRIEIDAAQLRDDLARDGAAEIALGFDTLSIDVEPTDPVADDARIVDAETGETRPMETGADSYRGTVDDVEDSMVSLTVTDTWVQGLVERPDRPTYVIEHVSGDQHRVAPFDGLDEGRIDLLDRQGSGDGSSPTPETGGESPGPGLNQPQHNCGPLGVNCLLDPNDSPNDPDRPDGPSSGSTGDSMRYCTSSDDPEGDDLEIIWDWDDGTRSRTGPGSSGSTQCSRHSWSSGGTYCVRARAEDSHGARSGWSPCKWVDIDGDTNDPPNTPSNPSPSDGATGVSTSPTLSWDGGDPDGDTVTYTVHLEAWDTTPDNQVCQTQSTWCGVSGLSEDTTYYWQVTADDGSATTDSAVWEFTTESGGSTNQPPNTPSNPSPSDGASNTDTELTLSWDGGDPDGDTVTYTVHLEAWDTTPDNQVCQTRSTWCDVRGLDPSTTYHWEVTADDGSETATSATWSFTVTDPPNVDSVDGPTRLEPGESGTYSTTATDPNGDSVEVWWTFDDGTQTKTGPKSSGSTHSESHSWSGHGWVTVEATPVDEHGVQGSPDTLDVLINTPPTAVDPWGQKHAGQNWATQFATRIDDADGDRVRFQFQWGDSSSTWTGWENPGTFVRESHAWSNTGWTSVCGVVEDEHGATTAIDGSDCDSVQVLDPPIVIQYTAYVGPHSSKSASDIQSLVNDMSNEFLQDTIVQFQLENVVFLGSGYDDGNHDCSDELDDLVPWIRQNPAANEVVQGFIEEDLDGSTVGCAYTGYYAHTLSETDGYGSIVQTKDQDREAELWVSIHEAGHTFNAEHEHADSGIWNCSFMDGDGCASPDWYFTDTNANRIDDEVRPGTTSSETETGEFEEKDFGDNQDPRPPQVAQTGIVGTTVYVDVTAHDPDLGWVMYRVDWDGDGFSDDNSSWVQSGTTVEMTHTYGSSGSKDITVWADDPWGETSSWDDSVWAGSCC